MRFGLHFSGQRPGRSPRDAWADDLAEIVTADALGFQEAWIREHGGTVGPMPAPDMFICKAAALTRQIRLAPERHLSFHHPVQVAIDAATADHLTDGRYMLSFSTGLGPGSIEMAQRGITGDGKKVERVCEAIDFILKCWSETEPFDFKGDYWQGRGVKVNPRPLQRPHMPLAINAASDSRYTQFAGEKGFIPLFFDYNGPKETREMIDLFLQGARDVGRAANRQAIRVCRFVYVADSVEQAKKELRESITPHIEYDKQFIPAHFKENVPPGGRIEDVTFDSLCDQDYFFIGDPDSVYKQVTRLYEHLGGFGVFLLRMGTDRGTGEGRARSMRLFAELVAPRLAGLEP
jgi:alkanesulfonate monooxygenase SsuD/methylene tetrahydromethanopterin reductase-like flavin-dependent oxidoreductase (luciferase family)